MPTDQPTDATQSRSGPGQARVDEAGADRFLHELLSAMVSFREGDVSVRLPSNLTGLHGRIANTFNDIAYLSGHRGQLQRERLLKSERLAREEAERQRRIEDEFLATLSHELRTPMNAILGWLSLLRSGHAGDPGKALTVIERNAKAQARLIEDLLLMNKLSSGSTRLELGVVDVAEAVEAAVQNLLPAATAKGIALQTMVQPDLPLITADGNRIQQILWNLLHNGVKFTSPAGRVEVRAVHVRSRVRVIVSDNGQGIAPEFLPHVFERFRQADSSTTRKALGLGLGLSIAKHLVELHGGSIEAASDGVGQGASFVVDLPIGSQAVRTAQTCLSGIEQHVVTADAQSGVAD